ncbi:Kunitz/Bovine pancreatic trypsin inhibitor domain protein [Oesophagostomum dentatum]|uniref:Kunitz/Bovine pancreatic trypsin inhibitor domain protein n=1 Tax=Oesophagostomum dentatum TaxID=61180 RepID=A0A0B1SJS3_OESDE|nr:Kunitz/Bovine pancreatic trypsin inhibitor domain protein [Oesophagostomum dentatum]
MKSSEHLTSPRTAPTTRSTTPYTTTARSTQPVTTPRPTQPVVTTRPPPPVTTYATAPPVVTTEATTERTTQRPTTQPPTTTAYTQSPVTTQRTVPTEPTEPVEPSEASSPLVITARVTRPPTTVYHTGAPAPYVPLPASQIICTLPPDAGSCFDYVPRWFFNAQSGQCEQFSYGSCGGNENNFEDRALCEQRCMNSQAAMLSQVPDRCSYDKDGGFGKGYNVKW